MDDFQGDASESAREQEEHRREVTRELIAEAAREMDVSEEVALYILQLETMVRDLGGSVPLRP